MPSHVLLNGNKNGITGGSIVNDAVETVQIAMCASEEGVETQEERIIRSRLIKFYDGSIDDDMRTLFQAARRLSISPKCDKK